MTGKRKLKSIAIIIGIILTSLVIGSAIYISDYYHADKTAIATYTDTQTAEVTTERPTEDITAYIPQEPAAGFIFYPGGKVEASSYEPLMMACAERGILCILIEMPGNLAVLDVKAADGIPKMYPEVNEWYIGGHSLGGSMAAAYAADRTEQLNGVVLLGAYSTAELTESDMGALCIYGSEDKVMDANKYQENLINLPSDYVELVIDGGCHAGFGMYGQQEGDGKPKITSEEQIEITADKIAEWIKYKSINR